MTTPRKRKPGGGRKPKGYIREGISMSPEAWAALDAQRGAFTKGDWIAGLLMPEEKNNREE